MCTTQENGVQNCNTIRADNNNEKMCQIFGENISNQNHILENIKNKLNSGSVTLLDLVSSHLL
jgi:hypothetical protein